MQVLRHAEDNNRELSGAKRRSRAAFGRSRALESTGTMLFASRSRFFASGSWRAGPLLRREERRRTTLAFSAQPSAWLQMEAIMHGKEKSFPQGLGIRFKVAFVALKHPAS
ncbi:unnamed protein product [Coccothraustes coccothraustes]